MTAQAGQRRPEQTTAVAFLGPPGTFTHAAARELFGDAARYVEVSTIDAAFDAVRAGLASFGVVPIENSTEGSVTRAVDALIECAGDVVIEREHVLEVRHCLMSRASACEDIERVYSHSQALAQCRAWLAQHLPDVALVETTSTAAAAREASVTATSAAIGGRFTAELYGLPVLRDAIHDVPGNVTRFVILAAHDAVRTGNDKTTVVFAVHDSQGALLRVLEVFDRQGISLTRIESRPTRQRPWEYVFLVDFGGHRTDENVRAALDTLAERCPMLRTLGSYPRYFKADDPNCLTPTT